MSRSTTTATLAAVLLHTFAAAQGPVPLADPVEVPLLPAGISRLPVQLAGEMAYIFQDRDGTDVVHIIGDFRLTLGADEGQRLHSHEAVVWTTPMVHNGLPYNLYEIMLWQEAEVVELAGTRTASPALFVTLGSAGELSLNTDDVAFQSSGESEAYRQGNAIREALRKAFPLDQRQDSPLTIIDAAAPDRDGGPRIRPVVQFHTEGNVRVEEVEGQKVVVITGGAYFARGERGQSEFLTIQADSVVVFLPPDADTAAFGVGEGDALGPEREQPRPDVEPPPDRQMLSTGLGEVEIESVYLEGDVRMSQGQNGIRASRLFYDFVNERALILDAVVRTAVTRRDLPLYLRAAEIRQLSPREFSAREAKLTTSEFYTPHYHVGAREVVIVDRTPMDARGQRSDIAAGAFTLRHATFEVGGVPILYWPYVYGNVDTSESTIRAMRLGYSGDFGTEIETEWDLFNLLGLEQPQGFDGRLILDYFSERGPAAGVNLTYERDRYFGMMRSYLINDDGEDAINRVGYDDGNEGLRGRFLMRHRQYLEDDWEVSLELSYISDRAFLEEFFESEFDLGKEQETLIYLKKQQDNWALTGLLQFRILDFLTQTEHLPDFGFRWVGEPLGDLGTWFSENRVGLVRLRGADQTFAELLRFGRQPSSATTGRLDSRQELERPFDLGAWRVVPFTTVRGSTWTNAADDQPEARAFLVYGMRGSMYLWRVYPDSRSELFDISGIRHVIKPEFIVWGSHTNVEAHELYAFDQGVETIDEIDGATFGVRQRWQTKRGEGENRRVVDVFSLDVHVAAFNDTPEVVSNGYTSFTRPEESIARNHVLAATAWRVNDRTAVLSETNVDLSDGGLDVFNLSFAVERPPRLSYLVGYRYIGDADSNLLGAGANYKLTDKHSVVVSELFDLDRGSTLDFTVAIVRRLPRWYAALAFELDDAKDDFGVSLSIWPEGFPRATIGSRRFSSLEGTSRIVPE